MKNADKPKLVVNMKKTLARRKHFAERMKNGYTCCVEFEDGSVRYERYSGEHKKIAEKFVPAPPSEELHIMVPVKVMKLLRKTADHLGDSEGNFIRKTLADRVAPKKTEAPATKAKTPKPPARASVAAANGKSNGAHKAASQSKKLVASKSRKAK
ncbi:hypothetical protein BH09SUM1_BH09SUM1_21330 [soil metagenome]